MNYTQNEKIEQVTESTLVLGVDIGSSEHYVRAFDYRGRELTRKVFRFSTDINGFNSFYDWVTQICIKHGKNEAMIGCEPTGHYWYTFYQFVKDHGMKLAFVNPASVKKAKELDDNSPKKTDLKDPKTIAKLVIDGRYSFPYVPEGIYAEIREVVSSRDRIMKELNAASNRIQRWLKIYFPEYLTVYKKFDTTTGMMILEKAPLPDMVKALGADHIVKKQQLEMVTTVMEELTMQIPNADKMLSVDGIGLVTVAGFISEVGDISRFKNPKQIQKYAGFELVENSSGKHKGRTTISKRGRKKLRKIIYQVVLPLIRSNQEFGSIYDYYRKRIKNPLKGRQAMIAVGCKLIRVFFAIMTKGVVFNGTKMIEDIHRPTQLPQAA